MLDCPHHVQTQQGHYMNLKNLKEEYLINVRQDPRWVNAPLDMIIQAFLENRARQRNWAPQTLHRQASSLHGVFANLPLYSNCQEQLYMNQSARWKLLMSKWKMESHKNQPQFQVAVTVEDLNLALDSTPNLRTQVCLILQWYLAARVGDILRLRVENIILFKPSSLQVTIDSGKTMAKRLPYTVNSAMPLDHFNLLTEYLFSLEVSGPKAPVFPTQGPTGVPWVKQQQLMRQALRIANPDLNTRAMRRGALQTMANNNVPPDTLMTFSGHTNIETLKRYLNYGRNLGTEAVAGVQAAAHLAPSLQA